MTGKKMKEALAQKCGAEKWGSEAWPPFVVPPLGGGRLKPVLQTVPVRSPAFRRRQAKACTTNRPGS